MSQNNSTGRNILTVVLMAIIVMALAFGLSLWQTPKYKAASKLIVVLNQHGIDAYTASKNSSYITGILSEVAYSNSFVSNVFESNPNLRDDLGSGQDQRAKNWKKRVKIKTQDSKGIIVIETFSDNQAQAYHLNQAVMTVFISKHGQYTGFNDQVTLKVIDGASIANDWNAMQVLQNTLIGLALGLFLGFSFVVVFPRQQLFKIASSGRHDYADETFGLSSDNSKMPNEYGSGWMDYSMPSPDQSGNDEYRR